MTERTVENFERIVPALLGTDYLTMKDAPSQKVVIETAMSLAKAMDKILKEEERK